MLADRGSRKKMEIDVVKLEDRLLQTVQEGVLEVGFGFRVQSNSLRSRPRTSG